MRESPLTDADVPFFWRELGLPGLIDVHVHFMPPRPSPKRRRTYGPRSTAAAGSSWFTSRSAASTRARRSSTRCGRCSPRPGSPALVHAGSGPVAGGFTGPGPFGEVMRRHPDLTVIIAHLGAPEYEGFLSLAERYDRVHLGTTGVFTDFFAGPGEFPRELLPRLRDLGLAGRILLGTDFPNIPYEYAHQLEALANLEFGDGWLREVCWHGAARLLDR